MNIVSSLLPKAVVVAFPLKQQSRLRMGKSVKMIELQVGNKVQAGIINYHTQ